MAALFSSSAVFAAPCADHSVTSRYNPQNLSERQECILTNHYQEDKSGIMGSIFWYRLSNGSYYSQPINDFRLQKAIDVQDTLVNELIEAEAAIWLEIDDARRASWAKNDKRVADAIAIVKADNEVIINDVNADIIALEEEIADKEVEIADLIEAGIVDNATIADLQSDIDSANASLSALMMALETANENAANLVVQLNAANMNVVSLEAELAAANDRISVLDTFGRNIANERDAFHRERDEARAALAIAEASVVSLTAQLDAAIANSGSDAALTDEITRLNGVVVTKDEEIRILTANNMDLQVIVDGNTAVLEAIRTQVNGLNTQITDLTSDNAELEATIAGQTAALTAFTAEVANRQAEIDALTAEGIADDVTIAGLQSDIDGLNIELDFRIVSLQNAIDAQRAAEDAEYASRQRIADLEGSLATSEASVVSLTADLMSSEASVMSLTTDLATAEASVVSLTAEASVVSLTAQLTAALANTGTDGTAEIARLTAELATAQAEFTRVDGDLGRSQAEVNRLTSELATTTSDLETTRVGAENLYNETVRLQGLVDANQVEINGLIAERDAQIALVGERDATIVSMQAEIDGLVATRTSLRVQIADLEAAALLPVRHDITIGGRTFGFTQATTLDVSISDNHEILIGGQTVGNIDYTYADLAAAVAAGNDVSAFSGVITDRNLAGIADLVAGGTITQDLIDAANIALESTYDNGFNDGYEEGYSDGYADGFDDGRAYGPVPAGTPTPPAPTTPSAPAPSGDGFSDSTLDLG